MRAPIDPRACARDAVAESADQWAHDCAEAGAHEALRQVRAAVEAMVRSRFSQDGFERAYLDRDDVLAILGGSR